MNNFQWEELLAERSQALLSSLNLQPYLPPEFMDAQRRKVFVPTAEPVQIKKAEARLGVRLPRHIAPFYRPATAGP